MAVSRARVDAVVSRLVEFGVPRDKINAYARGDRYPAVVQSAGPHEVLNSRGMVDLSCL